MSIWGRFARWLGFRKSAGSRAFARLLGTSWAWGGNWSSDRVEQSRHYRGWPYVFIEAIADEVAASVPCVAHVRGLGHGVDQKRLLPKWIRKKAITTAAPSDDLEPVEANHPLARLLNNPNPFETGPSFWKRTTIQAKLTGNFYWWLFSNGLGLPSELYVLPASWVFPRTVQTQLPRDGWVSYYEIRPWGQGGAGETLHLKPTEVIHWGSPGPVHPYDGYSPLTAGGPWVDVSDSIDRSRAARFGNSITPDWALILSDEYQDPSPEEMEALKSKLAMYMGEERTGLPFLVPPGMELSEVGRGPTEMDYTASSEQARDMIGALYRVGKSIVGITEEVNRATAIAARENFRHMAVRPFLSQVDACLSEKLAKRFDASLVVYHQEVGEFDPEEGLKEVAAGVRTPNEYRAEVGLPPYEHGGDDPLIPSGQVVLPLNTGEEALPDLDTLLMPDDRVRQQQEEQAAKEAQAQQQQEAQAQRDHELRQQAADTQEATAKALKLLTRLVKNVRDQQGHEHDGAGKFTGPGGGGDSGGKPDKAALYARLAKLPQFPGLASSDTVDPGFPVDMDPGIRGTVTDEELAAAPVEKVKLADLVATQQGVSRQHLQRKIDQGSGDKPVVVVRHGGRLYIHDGTHAATLAKLRGDEEVSARVFDYDAEAGRPVARKGYDPNEPRDEGGKWTEGGGGTNSGGGASNSETQTPGGEMVHGVRHETLENGHVRLHVEPSDPVRKPLRSSWATWTEQPDGTFVSNKPMTPEQVERSLGYAAREAESDRKALEEFRRQARPRTGQETLPKGPDVYYRIQWSGHSLSGRFRSRNVHTGAKEQGTSAVHTLSDLVGWVDSIGAAPSGDLEIVAFRGEHLGAGDDNEPVVKPTEELARYRNPQWGTADWQRHRDALRGAEDDDGLLRAFLDAGWREVDAKPVTGGKKPKRPKANEA